MPKDAIQEGQPGKEERQKDDAAEKAGPLKEDFTKAGSSDAAQREWTERERKLELYEREQARQQEQRRQEAEAQRQREAGEFVREKERLATEQSGRKLTYKDAKRAEDDRNAGDLKDLQDRQQKVREDAFAEIDRMGPEEAAAAREEMGKALEKKFREELEKLAREQQERAERLRESYRETESRRR